MNTYGFRCLTYPVLTLIMWLFFGHYFVGNNRRNFPFQWPVIVSLLPPLVLLASTLLVTSTWEAVKFVMLFFHLKAHRALAPMKILERFHGEHFNKYFVHLCHVVNIKNFWIKPCHGLCYFSIFSNIDMEKRWHTIHTVCLDLLDSPELRDLKDIKVPVLVSNLSKLVLYLH